ncbi:MAG: helix-turn-helix transcriptional regulator [Candidatus Andersenbacteria bacterium]
MSTDPVKAFGRRVQALRHERGFSQEKLAAKVGAHRTYLGMLERGERNPTLRMIYRVAAALSVAPTKLIE